MAPQKVTAFVNGNPAGSILRIYPEQLKQTIDGIGSSFTEASAFVLAHLDKDKRQEVMRNLYSADGANFSLARTHIGACDFTVEGKYSYDDTPDDITLEHFSLALDEQGFAAARYPGIKDQSYDLLPMIKEALAIKAAQPDTTLHIVASAWTAPAWMKDINTWYIPGSAANNWQGMGGSLKPLYGQYYANYLARYIQEYRQKGVRIWGLTPVNEPYGVNGQWESMAFDPASENSFIKRWLSPALRRNGLSKTRVLIYDQNRDGMEPWADTIFGDPETAPLVYGMAVHWYEGTVAVHEDGFERIHARFPNFALVHTEGCIDNLGNAAPAGVLDPVGFKEKDWFNNDDFWWHKNATDWAYSVTWQGIDNRDHPAYAPVHRYARNIIVSIDHWVSGWIDWNVVLDKDGGPNHAGNFCGAPVMIDTATQKVYYTPVYYVLAQLSRSIRPGDKAVQTSLQTTGTGPDDLHACATINNNGILSIQMLNTTDQPLVYSVQIGNSYAPVTIPANAVQTVQVKL